MCHCIRLDINPLPNIHMMRTRLPLLAITLMLMSFSLHAVTVSISVQNQPTCSYSNGEIQANASGGVGPYTYLWSTGATTNYLYGISAGTYSVTVTDVNMDQATANINLSSSNYVLDDTFNNVGTEGRCDQGTTIGVYPDGFALVGPPPYSMNGQQMNPVEIDPVWQPGDYVYVAGFYPPVNDSSYTFAFQDGNGCTGTLYSYQGWPVQWPSLTLLDVQGACSGEANGSVTFQAGLEGHQQNVNIELKLANGNNFGTWQAGTIVGTFTAAGLNPGQYWLRQWMTSSPILPASGCGDSTLVTIPDLGNTCGNVSGTAYMDDNLNCTKGSNEPAVPGTVMEILPGPFYAITSSVGSYSANLPLGSYTIEQQSATVVDHCNVQLAPFNLTASAGLATVNMGDTSLIPLDAMISAANGPARPGFQFRVSLSTRNLTPAPSGATSTVFTFDPTFTYVSSSPAGVVSGNTITWSQPQLTAFQDRQLQIYLQVPPDINLLGLTFNNTATLGMANADADVANNSYALPITVTGAYDPNDKQALTSTRSSTSSYFIDADNYIDYTIRFQNTGTDTAFNVVVTDTIAAELDLATFIAGASSHPYSLDIRNGNVLRWAFYNIQLPDSNVNEPASHGFVSFRIKPRLPLTPGTQIENIANIYFDFNPPVITEPSVLTAEFSTGVQAHTATPNLWLMPNPTSGSLEVRVSDNAASGLLQVLSVDGRVVMEQRMEGPRTVLDVSQLSGGLYTLSWHDVNGTITTQRFVRE